MYTLNFVVWTEGGNFPKILAGEGLASFSKFSSQGRGP